MTPIPGLPVGAIEQVRPHLKQTTGYVLARAGDCLDLQRREVGLKNRPFFKPLKPGELHALKLPRSWFLAVLLCPGDDTRELAAWVRALPAADRRRIRFYYYTGTRAAQALAQWYGAGLGPVRDDEIDGWIRFHHKFGAHHAIQVYEDRVAPA